MKPFGELTVEEQNELFQAWLDDRTCIEYLVSGTWVRCAGPAWNRDITYRIKPTKPSINWDHVNPIFKYLAVNANGSALLHIKEPKSNTYHERWMPQLCCSMSSADAFSSFKQGTCDWKDSLVERPMSTNV